MESWNKSFKEGNYFLSTHEAESLQDDDDLLFLEPFLVLFSTALDMDTLLWAISGEKLF